MAQLITSLDQFPDSLRSGAVAVGNFDGVHRGHAELIRQLVRTAKSIDGPAIVLTFDPPPVALLVPDRPPSLPLTSIGRRAALLGELGVDALVAYPTDRALLSLSAEDFFRDMIVGKMGVRGMVEGPNFRFGRDRVGDTQMLADLCQRSSIKLSIVEPKNDTSGSMISSTRIRELLADGKISEANDLLTQSYRIEGIVTKGAQRGRDLGFPTANLDGLVCLVPGHGVYAGLVCIEGVHYPAAVNIGPNPTFGESHSKVEIHVIGWRGDIYGERLECQLLKRVREIRRFESVDALVLQLGDDIAACEAAVATAS